MRPLRAIVPVLFGAAAVLAPAQDEAAQGYEGILSPSLAKADFDALAAEWETAVARDPDAPQAELLLRLLPELLPATREPRLPLEKIDALLKRPLKNGWVRTLLLERRLAALRQRGRWEEARRAVPATGAIVSWLGLGPVGGIPDLDLETPFVREPEVSLDARVDNANPVYPPAAWRRLRPDPAFTRLPLAYGAAGAPGTLAYLLAQVHAREDREILVRIETGSSFRLWWNGAPVAAVDRCSRLHGEDLAYPVRLRAGWNRLLLKLTTVFPDNPSVPSSVDCSLLERDGAPFTAWTPEEGTELRPASGNGTEPPDAAPRTAPVEPPALAHYRKAMEAEPARAFPCAAYGLLCLEAGLADDALFALRRALERDGSGNPFLLYHLGKAWLAADHLPDELRTNEARRAFEACLKREPAFHAASLELARLELQKGNPRQAVRRLDEVLEKSPDCLAARRTLYRLHESQGWEVEADSELDRIARLAPAHPETAGWLALRHRSRGEPRRAIATLQAELARYADDDNALALLAELWDDVGEFDKALTARQAAADRYPGNAGAKGARARALERAGKRKEAALQYRELAAETPASVPILREAAAFLRRAGEDGEASALEERAARLAPGDGAIRRGILYRQGKTEEPEQSMYAPDVQELIRTAPAANAFPRATTICLLDQAVDWVHADGSQTIFVHRLVKIVSEKGKEQEGRVPILGEILKARTWTPSGEVLEPVVIPGEDHLTMPGLATGAVVEYQFRMEQPAPSPGACILSPFYFQDPRYEQPYTLSRYVVIAPKSLPLAHFPKNFRKFQDKIAFEEKDDGDRRILVWEARQMPAASPEPLAPEAKETHPYAAVGVPRDWARIAREHRWLVRRGARPSLFIEEAARREAGDKATPGAAPNAGPTEVARRLYDFACRAIREDPEGKSRSATETLLSEKGPRWILFESLLRALEIPHSLFLARPSPDVMPPPDWELPEESDFAVPLFALPTAEGGVLWLDLRFRHLPFGRIGEDVAGGIALCIDGGAPGGFRNPPPPSETELQRTETEIRWGESGDAAVALDLRLSGAQGAQLRESFQNADPKDVRSYLERTWNRGFPGLVLPEDGWTLDTKDGAGPFRCRAKFQAPGLAQPAPEAGMQLGLGLDRLELARRWLSMARRETPLHLRAPLSRRDRIRIVPPPGWAAADLPRGHQVSGAFGTYSLAVRRDPASGAVEIERSAWIPPQRVSPAAYASFMAFCRAVDEAEDQVARFLPSSQK